MNATIKEILSKKNDFIGKKSSLKNNFHIIDENGTLLKEAKDEYIKEKILEMRKRQFGPNCSYEIKNKQLREFLDDEEVKNKALSYIKDSGKFCKFVADILLPKNALLKYYFPSEKTRRPIEQLFNDIIVQCYNITAKYLGLGIVAEEKHYLSYGIHLLNTRTYDKIARKANVLFYTLEHKPTFFSMEHVKPQSESDGDES
uniref:Uncharacterized protein n=1 Tax=Strongyloides papillosus TaxID=174720 RepID=A0A0N5B9D0_STREA